MINNKKSSRDFLKALLGAGSSRIAGALKRKGAPKASHLRGATRLDNGMRISEVGKSVLEAVHMIPDHSHLAADRCVHFR